MTTWQPLGAIPPAGLIGTRAEVHYAAEVVAAGSRAWLPSRPDWSHLAMRWDERRGAFIGPRHADGGRWAVGVPDATLSRLDDAGRPVETLELPGRTLAEALDWLRRTAPTGSPAPALRLGRHLPQTAHATGGVFGEPDAAARAELARWIGDLDALLAELTAASGTAEGTPWWPHHLDGAVRLRGRNDGAEVSAGLSLGDRGSPAPYLYVGAAELPEREPELRHGEWHTEGWLGAWLPGERLAALPPAEQTAAARAFYVEAVGVLSGDADRR